MLVLLISAIWLATLVLVVAVCRMAAYGDRGAPPRGARSPRLVELRAPWERDMTVTVEDQRSRGTRAGGPVKETHEVTTVRASPITTGGSAPAAAEHSEPAPAEHVGDGAQEDLYVRP
jgi:hypothetical protein